MPLVTGQHPKSSFAPSLPHTLPSQTPTRVPVAGEGSDDTHTVHVQVECCKCLSGTQMTPVRVYLCGYFSRLIQEGRRQTQRRQHIEE